MSENPRIPAQPHSTDLDQGRSALSVTRHLVALVFATLAVSSVALPAAASSEWARYARAVPSPYAVLDGCDATIDTTADTSYVQVRNGPRFVALRWTTRTCARPPTLTDASGSPSDYFVRFKLIEPAAGPGVSHVVFVHPPPTGTGYVVTVQRRDGTTTCVNRNYTELGPTVLGTLHAARFRFACIGGRQPFRTRMSSFAGDSVPNHSFTPVITPA